MIVLLKECFIYIVDIGVEGGFKYSRNFVNWLGSIYLYK